MAHGLAQISNDILADICDLLEATTIFKLILCGSHELSYKIKRSIRRFDHVYRRKRLTKWPTIVSEFSALQYLRLDYIARGLPTQISSSDFGSLSASLRVLKLEYSLFCETDFFDPPGPSAGEVALRLSIISKNKFSHLQELSFSNYGMYRMDYNALTLSLLSPPCNLTRLDLNPTKILLEPKDIATLPNSLLSLYLSGENLFPTKRYVSWPSSLSELMIISPPPGSKYPLQADYYQLSLNMFQWPSTLTSLVMFGYLAPRRLTVEYCALLPPDLLTLSIFLCEEEDFSDQDWTLPDFNPFRPCYEEWDDPHRLSLCNSMISEVYAALPRSLTEISENWFSTEFTSTWQHLPRNLRRILAKKCSFTGVLPAKDLLLNSLSDNIAELPVTIQERYLTSIVPFISDASYLSKLATESVDEDLHSEALFRALIPPTLNCLPTILSVCLTHDAELDPSLLASNLCTQLEPHKATNGFDKLFSNLRHLRELNIAHDESTNAIALIEHHLHPYFTSTHCILLKIKLNIGSTAQAALRLTCWPQTLIYLRIYLEELPLDKESHSAALALSPLGSTTLSPGELERSFLKSLPPILSVLKFSTCWGYALDADNIALLPRSLVTLRLPIDRFLAHHIGDLPRTLRKLELKCTQVPTLTHSDLVRLPPSLEEFFLPGNRPTVFSTIDEWI